MTFWSSEDNFAQENISRDASVVDYESNYPSETQHTDEEKEVGTEPPGLVQPTRFSSIQSSSNTTLCSCVERNSTFSNLSSSTTPYRLALHLWAIFSRIVNEGCARVVEAAATCKMLSNIAQIFVIVVAFLQDIWVEKGQVTAMATLEKLDQDVISLALVYGLLVR